MADTIRDILGPPPPADDRPRTIQDLLGPPPGEGPLLTQTLGFDDEFMAELDRRRPPSPSVDPSTAAHPSPLARVRADEGGGGFLDTVTETAQAIDRSTGRGVLNTIAAIPKGIAELGGAAEEYFDLPERLGYEQTPVEETPFYRAGEALEQYGQEAYPVDESVPQAVRTVAEGVGSTVPFIAGGGLGMARGLAAASGMGSTVTAAQTGEEAAAAGHPEMREEAAAAGALVGLTEGMPIGQLFRRLDAVSGGGAGRMMWQALRGAGEEGLQEAFSQAAVNFIANGLVGYDPGRGTFEGAPEAGATGAGVGAILNGIASFIGGRRGASVPVTEPTTESPDIPVEDSQGQQAPPPPADSSRPQAGVPPPGATPLVPAGPTNTGEGDAVPAAPPQNRAEPVGPQPSPEDASGATIEPQEPSPPDPNQVQATAQQDLQDTLDDPRPQAEIDAEREAQAQAEAQALEAERQESERQAADAIRQQLPPGFSVMADAEYGWTLVDPNGETQISASALTADDVDAWTAEAATLDETFDYDEARRIGDGTAENPVQTQAPSDVDAAAAVVEEPTPAQAEAGNYQKGHLDWNGLDIAIETPRGATRRGTAPDGTPWEVAQPAHYGYIKRSQGADGDQVDVYLGPVPDSDQVLVIDQIDPDTRAFDEHKAMLGFITPERAVATYTAAFSDGRGAERIGDLRVMSLDEFKAWVKDGKRDEPVAYRSETTGGEQTALPGTEPPEVGERAPRPRRRRSRPSGPQTLVGFLVARGGVKNQGDELGHMGALRQRPGLINSARGMSLDYAREAAAEAGYLREDADINDLLSAIDEELRGNRQYIPGQEPEPEFDPGRDRYEMEIEADRLGIPHDGMSDAELRDALADEYDDEADLIDDEIDEATRQVLSGDWQPSDEVDLGPNIPFPDLTRREGEASGPAGAVSAEPAGERQEDRSAANDGEPHRGDHPEGGARPAAEAGSGAEGTDLPGPLDSEQTAEGEQTLVPGVRPVTDRDRLQAQADKPLRGGNRPLDEGLFDTGARQQDELFMARPKGWTEGRIRREIRRGQAAMEQVIREHANVDKAMFRPEIGEIAFLWGKPGNPPDFKKNGYGISHIIARRNTEAQKDSDRLQGMDGESVARLMPEVIARGSVTQPYKTPKGRPRIEIRHKGWAAIVSPERIGRYDIWLVTGFREDDPGASGQPLGRSPDLRTAAHPGVSDGVGAGPAKDVSPQPDDDKKTLKRPVAGSRLGSVRRPREGTLGQPPRPAEVRAVHDLIRKLADAVGATIRHGRVRERNAEGTYNLKTGIVRVRNIQDIEVSAHEIAHHTEDHYGKPLQAIMARHRDELVPFDYESDREDEALALKEGFAEWFRIYITGNPNAIRSASAFAAEFEAFLRTRDPEVLEALHDVQQAYQTWLHAPSDMVVDSQVVTLDQGGFFRRAARWLKSATKRQDIAARARRLYTARIDKTHPIAVATRDLIRIYERNNPGRRLQLEAIENPAVLARLAADSNGTGFTNVMHGVVDYATGRPEGASLAAALEKALEGTEWTEADIKDFGAYLYSRRAVHEWQRYDDGKLRNRPTLETVGDHRMKIAKAEGEHKTYREAANMVYAWANALWRKKFEAGLISREVYKQALIDHPDYVPMLRWGEDLGPGGSGTGRKGKSSIVKTFGGSDRAVINPIETLMRDAYATERAIADNDIKKAMLRIANAIGPGGGTIVERIKDKVQKPITIQAEEIREALITKAALEATVTGDRDIATLDAVLSGLDALNVDSLRFWRTGDMSEKGEPIVYVWINGKRHSLRLADGEFGREVYDSLVGLSKEVSDPLIEALAMPARLLRAGITTEPSFLLANAARDMLSAWVLVDQYNPVTGLGSGVKSALVGDESKILYTAAGGIMGGEDANSFRQRALLDIRKLKNGGMNIRRLASWQNLFQVTEFTETGSRLGIFKNAYAMAKARGLDEKAAIVEAAFTARDYIDFGRHGSQMLAARRVVTFLNAALQGLDKSLRVLGGQGNARNAIRAYVKREQGFTLTSQEKRQIKHSAKAWLKVNLIGMIGLALTSFYKDDEEYKNISEYTRATHWMIRLGPPGSAWIAVPKPFELASLSNIYERAFEAFRDDDPTAWGKMARGLKELWIPPAMPTAVGPILEHWANKSMFTGAPIMSDRLLGRTPEEQFTQYTSSFAKWLGEQLGVSPVWIDHYITGYTGTWGRSVLALTTEATPGAPSQGYEDLPFFRRFIKEWTRSAVATDRFYNEVARHGGRLTAALNVFDDYVDAEQFADAMKYYGTLDPDQQIYAAWRSRAPGRRVGKWTANRMHPMYRADEMAGRLRNAMDDIRTMDDLSGDAKKRVIDLVQERVVYAMHNAMVLTGAEGYSRRRYFDLDANMDAIRAASPEAAKLIKDRTKNLPPFDYVKKKWPQVQKIARAYAERLRRKAAKQQ